ncbi:hypothetical protein [Paractinoplanes durhamensis]|uniref:Uncharacterized protein n=1 Tax=Paractinoplanes durhamensis TaxID=113563 RepID=A0ABQ3Z9W8_9ACTN|nr:hypothetical protein [Actinoplanes durhamensis]GIE06622.1 hypothetical protein Adu01nite_79720 [Actinoplanes durhamensis]
MTGPGDVLGLFDRLLAWLPEALEWLSADVRGYVVVPIVVVVMLAAPMVVVHRILPWAARWVLVPVAVVVTTVVAAAGLIVDFLAARLFRVFWLPLTGVHYAIGDWAVAGSRSARNASRSRLLRIGERLRWFSPVVLLMAGVVIVVLWSRGYCTRNAAAGCAEPTGRWWHEVAAALPDIDVPWS